MSDKIWNSNLSNRALFKAILINNAKVSKSFLLEKGIQNLKAHNRVETKFCILWNKRNINIFLKNNVDSLSFVKNKLFSYDFKIVNNHLLIKFYMNDASSVCLFSIIENSFKMKSKWRINFKNYKIRLFILILSITSFLLFVTTFLALNLWFALIMSIGLFCVSSILYFLLNVLKKPN